VTQPPARADQRALSVLVTVATARDARPDLVLTPAFWALAVLAVVLAVALCRTGRSYLRAEHAALHDPLTGLPNRALFADRLDQAIAWQQRHAEDGVAVLLVDLDRFKQINDTYGHHAGDRLLVDVSRRLSANLRASDTVARLGGDEFGVIVRGATGERDIAQVVAKLTDSLNGHVALPDADVDVDASVGVALYPHHGADAQALLKAADVAMYTAKRRRSGVEIYIPGGAHPAGLSLMSQLRDAIAQGDISAVYMPIVDLHRNRVPLVEALVRWNHPERGMLSPADFVPLAEATGLIHSLTPNVLDLAMHQQSRWRTDHDLDIRIAVNISVHNLRDNRLLARTHELLDRYDLNPSLLCFEITESTLMADPARAIDTLRGLAALGVSLAVDDFGIGNSSLAYLKHLPVDELKLDASFVRGLSTDHTDRALATSVIGLGHALGLRVVAEGVESREVHDVLVELGCDYAQGWLYSPPLDGDSFPAWRDRWTLTDPAMATRP